MRVRVLENIQTYFNYEVHRLEAGVEHFGEFARHLVSTGCPVEVLEEDPAPEAPTDPGASEGPGGGGDPGAGGSPAAAGAPAGGDGAAGDGGPGASTAPAAPEGLDIDGTMDTVLGWVGEDADRARQALDLEKAKGDKARATLVKRLEALAGVVTE